jgi:hypothetical protein
MSTKKTHATFQMFAFNSGGYSFTSYMGGDGMMKEMVIGTRPDGLPITKRFSFKPGSRILTVPNGAKDKSGKVFAKFLRESPDCEGSDLNSGRVAIYKELDPEKDAKVMLDAEEIEFKAKKIAFESKGEELINLAAFCNTFDKSEDIMKQAVLSFAKSNPSGLIDLKEAADTTVKASIKKFINKGVIYLDGNIHYWKVEGGKKPLMIGTSDVDAVSKLMEDKILMNGLTSHYERLAK